MCRLTAYLGHSTNLADLVTRPSRSVIRQSFDARERLGGSGGQVYDVGNLNADGFGLGWYTNDAEDADVTPCVFTDVGPAWNNKNLFPPSLAPPLPYLSCVKKFTSCGRADAVPSCSHVVRCGLDPRGLVACVQHGCPFFFFFVTLVTGPSRSSSLELSNKSVYAPQIRARLGTTAQFCKVGVPETELYRVFTALNLRKPKNSPSGRSWCTSD
jgi:hypothetical protein